VFVLYVLYSKRELECTCVRVCVRTHTLHVGYSDVSSGVGTRRLEGPKNSDRPNLYIHVSEYVNKVQIYVYIPGHQAG